MKKQKENILLTKQIVDQANPDKYFSLVDKDIKSTETYLDEEFLCLRGACQNLELPTPCELQHPSFALVKGGNWTLITTQNFYEDYHSDVITYRLYHNGELVDLAFVDAHDMVDAESLIGIYDPQPSPSSEENLEDVYEGDAEEENMDKKIQNMTIELVPRYQVTKCSMTKKRKKDQSVKKKETKEIVNWQPLKLPQTVKGNDSSWQYGTLQKWIPAVLCPVNLEQEWKELYEARINTTVYNEYDAGLYDVLGASNCRSPNGKYSYSFVDEEVSGAGGGTGTPEKIFFVLLELEPLGATVLNSEWINYDLHYSLSWSVNEPATLILQNVDNFDSPCYRYPLCGLEEELVKYLSSIFGPLHFGPLQIILDLTMETPTFDDFNFDDSTDFTNDEELNDFKK